MASPVDLTADEELEGEEPRWVNLSPVRQNLLSRFAEVALSAKRERMTVTDVTGVTTPVHPSVARSADGFICDWNLSTGSPSSPHWVHWPIGEEEPCPIPAVRRSERLRAKSTVA